MAKIIPKDGGKRVAELVTEAENRAGETERREQASVTRGRADAVKLANEAAERIREAQASQHRKPPPQK